MKGYLHAVLTALAIFLSFILPSCSKVQDFIEDHPSGIGKFCRIDSLTFYDSPEAPYGDGNKHFMIFYDGAGNPIELRQLNSPLFGDDYHFRYDKKGRLTDILRTQGELPFVYIWDRYSYPSQRTIIDSTYEYQGNVTDPNPPNSPNEPVRITKMQLDEEGRPVKFMFHSTEPYITQYNYEVSYDRKGNLVKPGRTYDDKVNIYQTSRTWQLLNGDFSRNNPNRIANADLDLKATPAAYNAYGLPTEFLGPMGAFTTDPGIIFFGHSYDVLTVTYSCDVVGPPPSKAY